MAVEVARFRLDTPEVMGMERRLLAQASSSALAPCRSFPKARTGPGGMFGHGIGSPTGSMAMMARLDRGILSIRATGRANCRPAAETTAAGCHGSCDPVTSTPAAPAAAATLTAAPMLNGFLGFSRSSSGASEGLFNISSTDTSGRCAIAIMPVSGGTGDNLLKSSVDTVTRPSDKRELTSGATSEASCRTVSASGLTISTMSAPKRNACFTACSPSNVTRAVSLRAWRKRSIIMWSVICLYDYQQKQDCGIYFIIEK